MDWQNYRRNQKKPHKSNKNSAYINIYAKGINSSNNIPESYKKIMEKNTEGMEK